MLITKQIVGNFSEILGPTLISWVKVYLLKRNNSMSQDSKSNEKLSQVETESEKPRYESSFDDYLEMFIQVGTLSCLQVEIRRIGQLTLNLIQIQIVELLWHDARSTIKKLNFRWAT